MLLIVWNIDKLIFIYNIFYCLSNINILPTSVQIYTVYGIYKKVVLTLKNAQLYLVLIKLFV